MQVLKREAQSWGATAAVQRHDPHHEPGPRSPRPNLQLAVPPEISARREGPESAFLPAQTRQAPLPQFAVAVLDSRFSTAGAPRRIGSVRRGRPASATQPQLTWQAESAEFAVACQDPEHTGGEGGNLSGSLPASAWHLKR